MEITAIIGAGNVGAAVGKNLAQKGHRVVFGVRNPQADKVGAVLRAAGENATAVELAEAAARADVILLATPWTATQEAIGNLGDVKGKILIDGLGVRNRDERGLAITRILACVPGTDCLYAHHMLADAEARRNWGLAGRSDISQGSIVALGRIGASYVRTGSDSEVSWPF